MAWYKPGDIADKWGGYLGGKQSANKTTQFTPLERDENSQTIWDDFMSAYGGLKSNITGETDYLNSIFGDYLSSANTARGDYQNTLSKLAGQLTDPNNQVSFGLGGSSPVSFTPRSVRENISTLEGLANKNLTTAMASPTEQLAFKKDNNEYAANQKYYDVLSALAKNIEDRRYQLATQSTDSTDTSKTGILDMFTGLGGLGKSASQLGSLGSFGSLMSFPIY